MFGSKDRPRILIGKYLNKMKSICFLHACPSFGFTMYVELDNIKDNYHLYVKVIIYNKICRMEEKIHCNMCDIDIDTSSLAHEHLSTSVHGFHKSNLEKILMIIRTGELYKPSDSVISYWKKSNA